jgi:hypothetical protein
LFVVEKYEFKLIGGNCTPTESEKAEQKRLAEDQQAKKDEEQTKKEAAEAASRRKSAAERARLTAACRLIYQNTIDKKTGRSDR